ncbi:chemotaxis protein CheB [Desulfococcaceae bacterium HSG9]|nr:chemotaxis protein CheB [Desulfococcaceae bacterium HSG9]
MNMPSVNIKVLLVDDSPVALAVFKKMLAASPEIDVVATAMNGRQALKQIPEYQPDVICSDLNMPVMDGYAFTKAAMAEHPRPILVLSTEVRTENAGNVFRAIDAGAVDVLPKPKGGLMGMTANYDCMTNELVEKIKALAKGDVLPQFRKLKTSARYPKATAPAPGFSKMNSQMVAIGASIGGPEAIRNLLSRLPADFPAAILCVLNIRDSFLDQLISWLSPKCALSVKIADNGEMPQQGVIYFPPSDKKLTFDANGRFSFEKPMTTTERRASITGAFNAAAERFGRQSVGILLSCTGDDGVEGLKSVNNAGGYTIVKDKFSGMSAGTYDNALALEAAGYVLPSDQIASVLTDIVSMNK